MRTPIVYTAREIVNWHTAEEYAPGLWRPARCLGFWTIPHIRQQLRIAWRVFTGRYDALNWEDRSGERSANEANYRDCTDPRWIRANRMAE